MIPEKAASEGLETIQPEVKASLLTCSDLQVTPEELFGLQEGELYTMKNVGCLITASEGAGVSFAHDSHRTDTVFVMSHFPCGVLQRLINDMSSLPTHIQNVFTSTMKKMEIESIENEEQLIEFAKLHTIFMAQELRNLINGQISIDIMPVFLDANTEEIEFLES